MEDRQIFRRDALVHAGAAQTSDGDVLRIGPRWTGAAFYILQLSFFGLMLLMTFGSIHEYAAGPAMVWVEGRVQLTAPVTATVGSVDTSPGARVQRGEILAHLVAGDQLAELNRVTTDLYAQTANMLREPSNIDARAAVATLTAQRELAQTRVDALSLRAPGDGIVGDIRIREGMRLTAGDLVLTVWSDDAPRTLVAFLPGHYRPQLRAGMSMRFEVTGYRHAYQELRIDSVGQEIVGPAEVRRYLGQDVGDTMKLEGSFVLVRATFTKSTFDVDRATLSFHHGMMGTAEARVRTQSVLSAVVPSFRIVTELVR